eukprot:5279265-Prymnesium_polylepis.1
MTSRTRRWRSCASMRAPASACTPTICTMRGAHRRWTSCRPSGSASCACSSCSRGDGREREGGSSARSDASFEVAR